jgi:hypothetical protein
MKILGFFLLASGAACCVLFILVPPMPGPLLGILGLVLILSSLVILLRRAKKGRDAEPDPDDGKAEITLHNEDPDDK